MSQHDLTIANQGFPAFRSDLNNALQALGSTQAGSSAPSPTFAHQMWIDTSSAPNVLKVRNADNDAWITVGQLNQTADTFNLAVAQGGTGATDAAGARTNLGAVGLSETQTLTNKTISADNNTLSGIAASSFVLSNASGNIDGSASQKAIPSGVVVGTTDTQTLTNKTISGADNTINNINGANISTGNIAAARIVDALNASGSAPIYACRAWVNFDGTGTPAIRASGNVSSITDNGAGDYTVNFTTALSDSNYCSAMAISFDLAVSTAITTAKVVSQSTTSQRILSQANTGNGADSVYFAISFFR
jgi:hypothetical protein